ncbi:MULTISPECIES: ATP-dependent helicase HrpB [unclassified Sphingomonas]|uniref:ATP-dependent helicase HrpB n=1 Tax=unclassified Sphingomonas TaxID=196159 RepID=UPI0006F6136E|nr:MULTISPECIES: ATP-dependent helicase HrpB [unclassified Sphingomonas]KQN14792.1 ATP-dependent helicase [Sphingomonas sp. Leaf30]MBD8552402.1 ATP-dependent helicase HrpB [Sphingomonas sp. CFBP 8764]
MTPPPLPILAVLPDLLAALRARSSAVLVAPPGAGKTTAVAPALLAEAWCTGEILLLSPRRLAARAAAERMAATAGEPVGRTYGYATRMDSKRSAATRVTVVTEGIFVARIQSDPELAGVSAVLFDEVHERSLDGDFGLALALDVQAGFRPDLRLVAMSATLDGARFAAVMDDAPVIESEGRSYPLTLRHIGRAAEARIEDGMAAAIRRALGEEQGGVLAFLPGVAEIERTADRLANLPDDIVVHELHGSLDPAAQRAAILPEPDGRRKVVLATSIAETSLTLDGIRIVIDSGLARRPRYDRAAGMTRLVTERASQAAVTQRAGRAARLGPGTAYRLWEEAATAGLPRYDPPEILEADLSALVLACALWGVADPRDLRWIDAPPAAAIDEALRRLATLEAIDADGRPTPHGRAIAKLPMPPRLAHMLLRAGERGLAEVAAQVAVLLGERGIGGQDVDVETRLRRWKTERGVKAQAARGMAERWARLAPSPGVLSQPDGGVATCIALGYPDRVARRRDPSGETWASVGGRGFRLDPTSPLARAEWLAVADTQGAAAGARILSAAVIDQATVEALFADRIESRRTVSFDPATGGIQALRDRRLGAIRLSSGPDSGADPDAILAALLEAVREHGLSLLPWSDGGQALRDRAAYAGVPLDDAALLDRLDEWLAPLLVGKRRLDAIAPGALVEALRNLLGWDAMQTINRLAPPDFTSPAGSTHAIDYAAEGGPRVELRVQALFGLGVHPTIGEARVPLVLSLTSPAGRPIQTTRDLPGFWAGSWVAVAKEMRGRYPKHPWPDDPAAASATLRTKKADARGATSR